MSRALLIPTGHGHETIEIPFEEIPQDHKEILDVLRETRAPLTVFHDAAVAYYRKGDFAAFEDIVGAIFSVDITSNPRYATVDSVIVRIRVRIASATYELAHGSSATRSREAAAVVGDSRSRALARFDEASHHINAASESARNQLGLYLEQTGAGFRFVPPPSPIHPAPPGFIEHAARGLPALFYTARAYCELYKLLFAPSPAEKKTLGSSVTSYYRWAEVAAGAERRMAGGAGAAPHKPYIPSVLAAGGLALEEKRWTDARRAFADAIKADPLGCPAAARVGLGLALYHLGHTEAAQTAFKRAIQLCPSDSAALSLHSTLELSALHDHRHDEMGGEEGTSGGGADHKSTPVSRSAAAAAPIELLKRSYGIESSSSVTSLELAHAYLGHWTPLTTTAGSGEAVTAVVTKGSRRIIMSEDVASRIHPNETLQLLVLVEDEPAFVPMRLVGAGGGAITSVPFSAVGIDADLPHLPASIRSDPSTRVCVVTCRHPWGLPSAAGVAIHVMDAGRAAKLARAAAASAVSPTLRAESYYALGRALHAEGKYVDAAVQYERCVETASDHIPARYGLALTLLYQRRTQEAIRQLEHISRLRPTDASASRTLAIIHADRRNTKEAVEHARKAHEGSPGDWQVAVLYASLLAAEDTHLSADKARKTYHSAVTMMRHSGVGVPPALHVNIGVLCTRLAGGEGISTAARANLLKEAEAEYERALRVLCQEKQPGRTREEITAPAVREAAMYSPEGITITFDLAHLYEMRGKVDLAMTMYNRILETYPDYHEARLRLGSYARVVGRINEAEGHYQTVVERASYALAQERLPSSVIASHRSGLVVALVFLGQLAERAGHFSAAKDLFNRAIAAQKDHLRRLGSGDLGAGGPCPTDMLFQTDTYAQLALANNLFGEFYRMDGSAGTAREDLLKRCFELYKDCLKRDPGCPYAGAGLAMVKAEQGNIDLAKSVFQGLIELTGESVPPLFANLAHLHVASRNHTAAQQLYTQALAMLHRSVAENGGKIPPPLVTSLEPSKEGKKQAFHVSALAAPATPTAASSSSHITLYLYLARSMIEAKEYERAMEPLMQALMLDPTDLKLHYNLAYVGAEACIGMAHAASGNTVNPEQDLERATTCAKAAASRFKYILDSIARLQGGVTAAESSGDAGALAAAKAALSTSMAGFTVAEASVQEVHDKLTTRLIPLFDQELAKARARAFQRAQENLAREAEIAAAIAARQERDRAEQERKELERKRAQEEAAALQQDFLTTGIRVPEGVAIKAKAAKKRARETSLTGGLESEDEDVEEKVRETMGGLFGSDDEDEDALGGGKRGKKKSIRKPMKKKARLDEDADDDRASSSSSSSSDSDSSSSDSDSSSSSGSSSSSSGSSSGSDSDSSSSSSSSSSAASKASSRKSGGGAAMEDGDDAGKDEEDDAPLGPLVFEDGGMGDDDEATQVASALPIPGSTTKGRLRRGGGGGAGSGSESEGETQILPTHAPSTDVTAPAPVRRTTGAIMDEDDD